MREYNIHDDETGKTVKIGTTDAKFIAHMDLQLPAHTVSSNGKHHIDMPVKDLLGDLDSVITKANK